MGGFGAGEAFLDIMATPYFQKNKHQRSFGDRKRNGGPEGSGNFPGRQGGL